MPTEEIKQLPGSYLAVIVIMVMIIAMIVGVELFADNPVFVKTALHTQYVRQLDRTAVLAFGKGRHGSLPVRPAVTLVGMSDALLRDWHCNKPLAFN